MQHNNEVIVYVNSYYYMTKKFEDIKGVIRSQISKEIQSPREKGGTY